MEKNKTITKPKVSVCVITFNQEKYIGPCLQSILDQNTDFDFEVIVGDDWSTDGTRSVVLEFASRYPDQVKPLLYDKKVGGTQNFIAVHNLAQGTFVAHIDGDDLALPGKLQTQVNYFEENSTCTVIWHRMNLFNDTGTLNRANMANVSMFENGKVFLSDVLRFGSIGYHSSMMYRASARKTRHVESETLDYYYSVEMLKSGYGKYLDDILGAYRYNIDSGISKKGKGSSFVMQVYARHLTHYLKTEPKFKKDIFINSMIYLLIEVKNRRRSALLFLKLAIKSFSFVSPIEFVAHLRRFKRINVGI
jgi:glycosyltransferase involved in cell wall biosynthesis